MGPRAILPLGNPSLPRTGTPVLRAGAVKARHIAVGYIAVVLALSTLATLAACAFALIIPGQLDEGEPLIYGLARRVLDHQELYQPIDRQPFVQVHYTPLYYAAVAVLRQLTGDGFAPGRLLSILCGLTAAALIGYVTSARARSWAAGCLAVLVYLGLGFPGEPVPFLALERVDMLGTAFSVAAVAILFSRTDRPGLVMAGLAAGLALLTKQSLFAALLAGTIWLASVDRPKAGVFFFATAVTAGLPALALQWSSGGAFWHNVGPDNPSPTALPSGAFLLRELVVLQGVPALLALVYVVAARAWRDPGLRLLVLYWLATMLSVVGIIKVGANHNYWIELAGANAILSALCIWSCMRANRRRVWAFASVLPIVLLGVQLTLLAPQRFNPNRPINVVPNTWTLNIPQLTAMVDNRTTFQAFFEQLRAEPDPVLAEGLDAAVLSGHPVEFEPFAFSMLEFEGRWNSQPLVSDICAGRMSLLVLSYPIENDAYPIGLIDFPMWPRTVMRALRRSMQLDRVELSHWLYRPVKSADAAAVVACEAEAARPRILAATASDSNLVYDLHPFQGDAELQSIAHLELPTSVRRGLSAAAVLSFTNGARMPRIVALPIALSSIAPDAAQAQVRIQVTGPVDLSAAGAVQFAALPTSAQQIGLRASIEQVELPPAIRAASTFHIDVLARNVGQAIWLAFTADGQGAIGVAVHNWIGSDNKPVQVNGGNLESIAGHLDWNVSPGQEAAFSIEATAPPIPGDYDLVLDMLSEKVTWFDDVQGGARTVVPVHVAP